MPTSVPIELRRSQDGSLVQRYVEGVAAAGAGSGAPSFEEAFDAYRLLTIDGWIAIVFSLAAGGMQPTGRMEVTAVRAVEALQDLDVEQAIESALR